MKRIRKFNKKRSDLVRQNAQQQILKNVQLQLKKQQEEQGDLLENEQEEQQEQFYGKEGIIKGLRSLIQNERELVLISLSNLSERTDEEILRNSIDENVLNLLVEGLKEQQATLVQLSLRGISNMLSIDFYQRDSKNKEVNFIDHFLRKTNLLQTLFELIVQLGENLVRITITEIQKFESIALLEEIFDLVANMLQIFSEQHLKILLEEKWGQQIIEQAFNFLQLGVYCQKQVLGIFSIATELNSEINKVFQQKKDLVARLLEQMFNQVMGLTIQSLSCQILVNIYEKEQDLEKLGPLEAGLPQKIAQFIVSSLSINIFEELNNLKQIAGNKVKIGGEEEGEEQNQENEQQDENNYQVSAEEKNFQNCYKIWMESAEAIQTVLGLLINFFEDSQNEQEFDQEEEEIEDFSDEEQENTNQNQTKNQTESSNLVKNDFKSQVVSLILNPQLIKLLLEKQATLDKKTVEFFSGFGNESEDIFKQCFSINEFSLSALNNLIHNYTEKFLNQEQISNLLAQIWQQLTLFLQEIISNPENTETQSTNNLIISQEKLILGLLKKITNKQNLSTLTPTQDFLKIEEILNNINQINNLEEEVFLVFYDLIAFRFHPLNNFSQNQEIQAITTLLFQKLQHPNPMIQAQVLNAFFDIYSEENYDSIFLSSGLITTLRQGRELLQQNLKTLQNILDKNNFAFVKDTFTNLKRFIKYKEKMVPNLPKN